MKKILGTALVLLLFPLALQCGEAPLCCGKFSIAARGGIAPSSYTNRGAIWATDPAVGVFAINPIANFNRQFRLPWTIGAELGWNATCRIQFFLEYSYTQAGKTRREVKTTIPSNPPATLALQTSFTEYRVNAGYLGARYFFTSCLEGIFPYVGFKSGFAAQSGARNHLTGSVVDEEYEYWLGKVQVNGGLQIGLEWWLCRGVSLLFQGEFVGTCGLSPNRNVELSPPSPITVTNLNIGSSGWIVAWPVTLGLRYTF